MSTVKREYASPCEGSTGEDAEDGLVPAVMFISSTKERVCFCDKLADLLGQWRGGVFNWGFSGFTHDDGYVEPVQVGHCLVLCRYGEQRQVRQVIRRLESFLEPGARCTFYAGRNAGVDHYCVAAFFDLEKCKEVSSIQAVFEPEEGKEVDKSSWRFEIPSTLLLWPWMCSRVRLLGSAQLLCDVLGGRGTIKTLLTEDSEEVLSADVAVIWVPWTDAEDEVV